MFTPRQGFGQELCSERGVDRQLSAPIAHAALAGVPRLLWWKT